MTKRTEAAVCSNCGARAQVVQGAYRFKESGLKNVVLLDIDLIRCRRCRNIDPIIPNVNELMRVLARAVASQPYRLSGQDVRFLRKYLKLTGVEFARLLNVDKTTLSKWENNDDRIGEQSDRLIRMVALALGKGLKERLEEAVWSFRDIEDKQHKGPVNVNMETLSVEYA